MAKNFITKLAEVFSSNKESKNDREIQEVSSSISRNKNFFVKFIGSIRSIQQKRGEIVTPDHEYNFNDIYNAYMTDSYVNVAVNKYKSLVYKAGYQLKSENDKAVEYLNQRFKIFGLTTSKPMDILFQEVSDDLVMYSNAFILKKRSDDISIPGLKQNGVFSDKPVAGYFRADPRNIKIEFNNHGSIKRYIYTYNGNEQYFGPLDVIHIYMDKTANHSFGTPRLVAALEDVKLLRRIEGNVAVLIYRFAMPTYHWKVGLEENGQGASQKEIDELTAKVAGMELDGCIVTNERTKISAVGAEGTALDATGYLSYFEKRVFSALGMSESQMGRGGAKQDADSMESQIHDTIKYIQRHLSVFIENYILTELLLEGGFNPITNDNDYVYYSFNEISLDTKIKLENHEMTKFQSNLITFSEVRHELNKKADNINTDELYTNMITNKSAIDQINAKVNGEIKVAKATAKLNADNNEDDSSKQSPTTNTVSGIKGNGTQKSSVNPSNGTIKSINAPSNQHGTTSVKIKESNDKEFTTELSHIKDKYSNISVLYQNIKEAAVITKSDLQFTLTIAFDKMQKDIDKIFDIQYQDGKQKFLNDYNTDNCTDIEISQLNNTNKQDIISLSSRKEMNKIKNSIINACEESGYNDETINASFDCLENCIFYMLSYLGDKSYWNGYIDAAHDCGIDNLCIEFSENSRDANKYPDSISTFNYNIDDIPSYHAFCQCKLIYKSE